MLEQSTNFNITEVKSCVGCQSRADSRVDAHVCQHPDQLDQHVLVLLRVPWRGLRLAVGRGTFLRLCVWRVVSPLVGVVQLQEGVHAALALEELPSSLVASGCEVPDGEKKAHNKILWENGDRLSCATQSIGGWIVTTAPDGTPRIMPLILTHS
ncbi:hypothetical protein EYF80_025300 [Liparis tanakae]|uniref:Uncharacterized protein n=1 Tax=Liparis tanakae TaxID=230148 RepID=A0A4Z2HF36_9TELE|nr:hypothetical protein EYF80_025300 [Liparis tanakae]